MDNLMRKIASTVEESQKPLSFRALASHKDVAVALKGEDPEAAKMDRRGRAGLLRKMFRDLGVRGPGEYRIPGWEIEVMAEKRSGHKKGTNLIWVEPLDAAVEETSVVEPESKVVSDPIAEIRCKVNGLLDDVFLTGQIVGDDTSAEIEGLRRGLDTWHARATQAEETVNNLRDELASVKESSYAEGYKAGKEAAMADAMVEAKKKVLERLGL